MSPSRLLPALMLIAMAIALPASASAQAPQDLTRISAAVVELAKAKDSLRTRAEERGRATSRAMRACRNRGTGWKRIRSVGDPSQRNAYARAARELWAELTEAAAVRGAVEAFMPAWQRYLRRLETPFTDPVIEAGAEAMRGRIAYMDAGYSFATCGTFERVLRKVREFEVGGEHGVSGDYKAGRLHNIFVRYVDTRQRRESDRRGGRGYSARLAAARARITELGGDAGHAAYFVSAHSLNN